MGIVMQYKVFGTWALGVYKLSQSMFCGGGGRMGVCLLSSFILFRTRYVRSLMAIWCMFFMRVLMMDFGIFISTSLLMKCSCIAPLTATVMVMSGLV